MRAHILQHVPFEDTGSIARWLESRKAESTYTRFFAGDRLPSPGDPDLVIVMGGPMSANDEAGLPWLRAEKNFIRGALERNTPMLGICLGAQLIASALGARVYRNPEKEIGWFPVLSVPPVKDCFHFPEAFYAFHWHGETFDLPEGSIHLARSRACARQAFQVGDRVIGLQFHLETTPQSARALVDNCCDELQRGPYIQSERQIMGFPASAYEKTNRLMDELLSYITRFHEP
ncbi:MAG: type 1 glutamine amidotransferase [Acidobacteria bacterium]|nr:type 1 glutamine amidotransferase [Acidobacteriota bacterium]